MGTRPTLYFLCAAISIWLLNCLNAYADDRPLIFNWSESAQPGEVIGLQGSGLGSDPEVWIARVDGGYTVPTPSVRLSILVRSEEFVAARVPSKIGIGLYAVWLMNGGKLTGPVWVNRARPTGYEFPEICPGGKFRIWGRNLSFVGRLGDVSFTDPRTNEMIVATAIAENRFVISVTAPSNLNPGVTYEMRVSNGYGGQYGQSSAAKAVKVRERGFDHFGLGVPWAADFDFFKNIYNVKSDPRLPHHAIGNGLTNDRAAIQGAIDRAAADHGGVVYLPSGSYALTFATGQGLTLRSRVVLQGAGMEHTTIKYGLGNAPPSGAAVVWPDNTQVSGIEGIRFINTNSGGGWQWNIRNLGSSDSELFVHEVRADLDTEGMGVSWKSATRLLLANSTFILGPKAWCPYQILQSSWFTVRGNVFEYLHKRIDVENSKYGLIEENHSTRDFNKSLFKPGDSGGIDLDFVNNLALINNTFDTLGQAVGDNDGEAINSQGCNTPNQDLGTVTNASAATLADATKQWADLRAYFIAIVTGPGAGQWRQISTNTPTLLNLSEAWTKVPSPGSRYVISKWSADALLIYGNTLSGNPRGIWLYCGGSDTIIARNELRNSQGIWLRADQRLKSNRFNVVIGADVENNRVTASHGKAPAFIAVELAQFDASQIYGSGVYNVTIKDNSVSGNPSDPRDVGDLSNGIWSWVRYTHGGVDEPSSDVRTRGVIGTIVEDNRVAGCRYPYNISTGDLDQVILDPSVGGPESRDLHGRDCSIGASDSFVGR